MRQNKTTGNISEEIFVSLWSDILVKCFLVCLEDQCTMHVVCTAWI